MINIGIVGFGNLGHAIAEDLPKNPDMKLVAIFTRRPEVVKREVGNILVFPSEGYVLPENIQIDVAILCGGSKDDIPKQGPAFAKEFSTVDAFDNHPEIYDYLQKMDAIAKEYGNVSVVSAGWDPGIFSIMKVYFDAVLPDSKVYIFYGPGVSQGHSDAARQVQGVSDARAYTIPIKKAIQRVRKGEMPDFEKREMHGRLVYVTVQEGADRKRIREEIIGMKNYYAEYKTTVRFITKEEMERDHSTLPHRGFVHALGSTGKGNRQVVEFSCELSDNPGFTGGALIACARAADRFKKAGRTGAFTMPAIAPELLNCHTEAVLRKMPFM